MASCTSSFDSSTSEFPSYFNYDPASCEVSPIKSRKPDVRCLDAFHQRPAPPCFGYPENASLYAKRALPSLPVPPLSSPPALQRCVSADSVYSGESSRPSTSMTNRASCEKSLPPLPLQEFPTLVCVQHKPAEKPQKSRPRAGRSISFRGLIERCSTPSASTEDIASLACSMSSTGTRDSRADSVVGDYALTQDTMAGHKPARRRPSALSLSQLRAASKKANAAPPPMPVRPITARKYSASAGAGHRWNPFGRDENKEDIPPMPNTPPFVQELSFTQCYYFYARNCNGYILSHGTSGDACENCARSGYLGSP